MRLPPATAARVLALAAGAPPRPRPRPPADPPAGPGPGGWRMTLAVPGLVLVSEANSRDNWTIRRSRSAAQQLALGRRLLACPRPPLPVRVTFVRLGRRVLDSDNLAGGCKYVQDLVARWLGCDDGDASAVRWAYRQRPGDPGLVLTFRPFPGVT